MFVYLKYVHGVSLNKVTQRTQVFADVQNPLMLLTDPFNLLVLLCKDRVNADKVRAETPTSVVWKKGLFGRSAVMMPALGHLCRCSVLLPPLPRLGVQPSLNRPCKLFPPRKTSRSRFV